MAVTGTAADVDLAEVYQDLHAHPELGFTETRTAGIVAGRLRALGYETATGVGGTGVVGVLRNGTGPAAFAGAAGLDEVAGIVRVQPSNHSPRFAAVIEPTLGTGIAALVSAARGWLPALREELR